MDSLVSTFVIISFDVIYSLLHIYKISNLNEWNEGPMIDYDSNSGL